MEERAGRDFIRVAVGMVSRRAALLAEGVVGRAGGTRNSRDLKDLARDAAVGSSYRAAFDVPEETEPEPDAWLLPVSRRDDKDALRVIRAVEGGVGGLRPECDFWPRRLPGFGERNDDGAAAVGGWNDNGGGERAWKV